MADGVAARAWSPHRYPLDVPQAVVTFGGPGIARSDPDFMAAYIVNHILGGGSLSNTVLSQYRT